MPALETHQLDVAVREAAQRLKELNFVSPEVLLLLGTGAEDIVPLLEDAQSLQLDEVPGAPSAWSSSTLMSGKLAGVRVWVCEDILGHTASSWDRAWPVWLSRHCGAGRALITTGASPLPQASPPCSGEGLFIAQDHLMLEASTPLCSLGASKLGPLFPDQGAVHDSAVIKGLKEAADSVGLPCQQGVLACITGPALETPAEQAYHALAGAHATAQNIGGVFHAMAHSGLSGVTLAALLGDETATVEDLVATAQRLAPSLHELILSATALLAVNARAGAHEQL
ncbi:MAG: hypothetical protein OSB14_11125 [Planctomycetota bacterium]|nr:hypothetical protein [Planctomycetota bacterium]